MKTLFRYGAVASVFLMTAGTAALAQNYNPTSNPKFNQGYNSYDNSQGVTQAAPGWDQGMQSGGQGWNQSMQGGTQGWGQQKWVPGMQGSTGMNNQSFASGSETRPTPQEAQQELSKFGYRNVQVMEPIQGWTAHATKNGDPVLVVIDDNGRIATYSGD
jgi:hypothetical protein